MKIVTVLLILLPFFVNAQVRRHHKAKAKPKPVVVHFRPAGWSASRPAYTKAPQVWEGHRYYTYRRYSYHPYRPFVFGPAWRPVGSFVQAPPSGATVVVVNDRPYQYDNGVYYEPYSGGYQAVAPPVTALAPALPEDRVVVRLGDETYYYYGGVFYQQAAGGYRVVRAPGGAIVYNLPAGCATIRAGNLTYLQYNGDYYLPVDVDGAAAYEVVNIE